MTSQERAGVRRLKHTSVNLSSMAGTPANAVKLYAPLFTYNGFRLTEETYVNSQTKNCVCVCFGGSYILQLPPFCSAWL